MILSISHVHHAFGSHNVLQDVSFTVAAGEVICLLGPSGCGKTTLLRLIAGLEILQNGEIAIGGNIVASTGKSTPPEQRHTGVVFQDFALFPHLNVRQNVAFGLRSLPKESVRAKTLAALRLVGMEKFIDHFPHQLSGGQQQRVALARALAPEPKILLLDEPFSSLDTRLRSHIRDETLHILKKTGIAAVMVTHDPEEAMFMGDRIALMSQGVIVQIDNPQQLYYHPINAFVASFFSDVNRIEGFVEAGVVATPFGQLDAAHIPDMTPVEIFFRPESLQVSFAEDAPHGVAAEVSATRMLVGSTLIHMRLEFCGPQCPTHIHAKIAGRIPLRDGARVMVTLDPSQVFIFPGQICAGDACLAPQQAETVRR